MLEDINPWQWHEWQAFGRLRPFGDRRADLRNALLAVAIDCVVSRVVGADPSLDPRHLMPFDQAACKGLDESGWEDAELQLAKLDHLAQLWANR